MFTLPINYNCICYVKLTQPLTFSAIKQNMIIIVWRINCQAKPNLRIKLGCHTLVVFVKNLFAWKSSAPGCFFLSLSKLFSVLWYYLYRNLCIYILLKESLRYYPSRYFGTSIEQCKDGCHGIKEVKFRFSMFHAPGRGGGGGCGGGTWEKEWSCSHWPWNFLWIAEILCLQNWIFLLYTS